MLLNRIEESLAISRRRRPTDQANVGTEFAEAVYCFGQTFGAPDNVHIGLCREEVGKAIAEKVLLVDDQYSY